MKDNITEKKADEIAKHDATAHLYTFNVYLAPDGAILVQSSMVPGGLLKSVLDEYDPEFEATPTYVGLLNFLSSCTDKLTDDLETYIKESGV